LKNIGQNTPGFALTSYAVARKTKVRIINHESTKRRNHEKEEFLDRIYRITGISLARSPSTLLRVTRGAEDTE
jgi:hypothetical protein